MTVAHIVYIEPDKQLGAAFLFLENAVIQLQAFRNRHPERMNAVITSALSHAEEALTHLDGDFYTDGNGELLRRRSLMTRYTPEEVELHVHAAAASMLDNLVHDYWQLPTQRVPYAARLLWDQEILPAIVRYCQEVYRANPPQLKRIVAVLDVEDEEGIDRALIEGVPTVKAVIDVHGWDGEVELALRAAPSPGEPEQAARENIAMARSANQAQVEPVWDVKATVDAARLEEKAAGSALALLERELADSFFQDEEPGAISEEEYQKVLGEIQNASTWLLQDNVWRVEYNVRWGQAERVQYVEASSEEEARGDESKLPRITESFSSSKTQVRVVSCRRADPTTDLADVVADLARELGWWE